MTAVAPDRGRAAVQLVYVTAPNCRLCAHGRRVLEQLTDDFELSVHEIDLLSSEGRRLIAVGRVPFPPAVFVNNRLVAHGRLSARSLTRKLEHLTTNTARNRTRS